MLQGSAQVRERRVTAGRRMNELIGKASEDDEAFWSHSTWKDDVDFDGQAVEQQDDASFHESDEDESDREDAFDSDFDDTESEGLHEEMFDDDAELEAHREEVKNIKKKKVMDMIRADRISAMKRKKATGKKSIRMGDGLNAGIRLKAPGALSFQHVHNTAVTVTGALSVNLSGNRASSVQKSPATIKKGASQKTSRKRPSTQQSSSHATLPNKKIKKLEFSQEDLLLEAIHHTEPENMRWILARKRVIEDTKALELHKKMLSEEASAANRQIISRYHSKRGCYNSITFPDMDHVPEILVMRSANVSKHVHGKRNSNDGNVCVITGKLGRYRDPKTGMKYHDIAAFKELRRRLERGEKLCTFK